MNGKFVLDTCVVVDFLAGKKNTVQFLHAIPSSNIFVSSITRMELLSYPDITLEEEITITDFLASITVFPFDKHIENTAIAFRRKCKKKLPDSIIAATAIQLHACLITRDAGLYAAEFEDLKKMYLLES